MASVVCTALSTDHTFTKRSVPSIELVKNLGVQGDCHAGTTVQHRSRLHIHPSPPNLRQVHLIHIEVLTQNEVLPAEIGENITTQGIDLLRLGQGTKLHFLAKDADDGAGVENGHAVVAVTGLRNPCPQIEKHRKGLQAHFVEKDEQRRIVTRKAGIMSVVEVGGVVTPGMKIVIEEPECYVALEPV